MCDSLRYVTSEVLIGALHVRNNHSLTHTRSIYTVAYPEFQRGGCLRLGGGGGGGGKAEIIYIISGGGEGPFLVRYEKCVCVWEGGDAVRFKSDTKSGGLWHTANTLSLYLITNGYRVLKSTRSTLSRSGYEFSKGGFRPAIQWRRARERGGGGGGNICPRAQG